LRLRELPWQLVAKFYLLLLGHRPFCYALIQMEPRHRDTLGSAYRD
jgi:hypothetical protein